MDTISVFLFKMKIIIASNSYWNLYNFRKGLIEELILNNHEVTLVAPTDKYRKYFDKFKCNLIDIKFNQNKISIINDIVLTLKFFLILLKKKPNYLLTFTVKPNIYFTLSSIFLNIKVYNNITGLGTGFTGNKLFKYILIFLYRISFIKSSKIFFHNSHDMKYFVNLGVSNNANSIILPGSGVNLNIFKYSKLENRESNLNLNFLYFGRMLKEKGLEELIKTSILIKKKFINITFTFVGSCDDNNKSSLKMEYLQNLNKLNVINYIEHTNKIIDYIIDSDCVILPSYREGFPKSLIEASAIGRPMITSNIPGCRDIVTDGYNGFLFNPRDVDDMTNVITKFINLDFNLKNQMSINANKIAINKFDEKKIINKYVETINN